MEPFRIGRSGILLEQKVELKIYGDWLCELAPIARDGGFSDFSVFFYFFHPQRYPKWERLLGVFQKTIIAMVILIPSQAVVAQLVEQLIRNQ